MVRESSDSANRQTPSAGSENARTGKRGDRKTAGGRVRALNLVEKGAKKRTRLRGGASKRQRRIDSVSAKCQREMSARNISVGESCAQPERQQQSHGMARQNGQRRTASGRKSQWRSTKKTTDESRRSGEIERTAARSAGRVNGAHPIVTERTEKKCAHITS